MLPVAVAQFRCGDSAMCYELPVSHTIESTGYWFNVILGRIQPTILNGVSPD